MNCASERGSTAKTGLAEPTPYASSPKAELAEGSLALQTPPGCDRTEPNRMSFTKTVTAVLRLAQAVQNFCIVSPAASYVR